jgi:hypothetical protein
MDLGEAEPRQLAIQQNSQGDLVLDGVRASVSDATAACGGVPGGGAPGDDGSAPGAGGGSPDVVEQLTQAFAGHALILVTSNTGSGTTTTIIVLCDTGRYVKEVTISATPGFVQDTFGPWSIEVTNAGPALILADEQGGPPSTFTIAEDTDGNLLLNGIAVSEGDPDAVPGICAQI